MAVDSSVLPPPCRQGLPAEEDHFRSDASSVRVSDTGAMPQNMEALCERFGLLSDQLIGYLEGIRSQILLTPFAAALAYVIRQHSGNKAWQAHVLPRLRELESAGILHLLRKAGEPLLADLVKVGHEAVFEEIRCHSAWTHQRQEEIVSAYTQLSEDLSELTAGLVPAAQDSVRLRCQYKAIAFESFIRLTDQLSERNSLIAQVLYFGAPSLDSVLALQKSQIPVHGHSLVFETDPVALPSHLVRKLRSYAASQKSSSPLVFANVNGEPVDRTHLNQAFARVCARQPQSQKISPAALLR